MSNQRPRSRGKVDPDLQEPGVMPIKVFNCIVDETALIQGAKKSTRDGIPKWIAAGRMRLFVPLYALTQASRVKATKGRAASDASEALEWLDDATSTFPYLVTLQGGYDKFETWAEVEKFALPRTLFSEEDGEEDSESIDGLRFRTENMSFQDGEVVGHSMSSNDSTLSASSNLSNRSIRSASPLSPPISPPKQVAALRTSLSSRPHSAQGDQGYNGAQSLRQSPEGSDTPRSIQPLFNYILWRVHQETDPAAALDAFIFLSDNPAMRKYAQRFGIRTKTLSEIRYVIARESQDDRNRQYVQRKGKAPIASANSKSSLRSNRSVAQDPVARSQENAPMSSLPDGADNQFSDEDEILLKRAPKAPAALIDSPKARGRVIDPNQFQRSPVVRGSAGQTRGSSRGSSRPTTSRGRGGSGGRGRGHTPAQQPAEPIDPDSFTRPSSSRGATRGGRGLWIPT